jgi:thiol-disulfide isomerase/thioredoxin
MLKGINNKEFYLICLLWVFHFHSFANVIINGKLSHNIKAFYFEPINGYENSKLNQKKIFVTKNNYFNILSQISESGYLIIQIPTKTLRIFVSPGDSIFLDIKLKNFPTQEPKFLLDTVIFSGTNYKGHNLVAGNLIFFHHQEELLNKVFIKQNASVIDLYKSSLEILYRLQSPLYQLYDEGAITKEFFEALSMDLKSTFAYELINLFGFFCKRNESESRFNQKFALYNDVLKVNSHLFKQDSFKKVRLLLYEDFDPLNKKIKHSLLGSGFSKAFCDDLLNKIVSKDLQFDSSFLMLQPNLWHLGYFPEYLKEGNWANAIYWSTATESDTKIVLNNFELFKKSFPHSPYIIPIKERLSNFVDDAEVGVEYSLVKVLSSGSSIEKVIKEHFKDKYVFVDLWATWCVPCIQEFLYKNRIKQFLDEHHIQMLYISIDDNENESKWKDFINNKNLYGYHILASAELLEDIKKLYSDSQISIPRYLFIDKKGKIKGLNMPRPSETDQLKNEIIKQISN